MTNEYDEIQELSKSIQSKLNYSGEVQHGIYERLGCLPLSLFVGTLALVTTCNHTKATYKELEKVNKTNNTIVEGLVKRLEKVESEQNELKFRLNENDYSTAEKDGALGEK